MDIVGLGCCAVEELNYIADNNSQLRTLELYAQHHYEPAFEDTDWVINKVGWGGKEVPNGKWIPAKWTTPAFCLFSEAARGKYGKKLAALIAKHGLGEVQVSPTRLNPNSDNMVTVYLWAIDREAFHVWAIKQGYVEVNDEESDD